MEGGTITITQIFWRLEIHGRDRSYLFRKLTLKSDQSTEFNVETAANFLFYKFAKQIFIRAINQL